MDKRGIELSLNFLVIIILSVVVFSFGISFIYNLLNQATELQSLSTNDLDNKIGNLACEGFDRVCIGIDRKTIRRTQFDVFGVKLLNVNDNPLFDVTVSPSEDFPSSQLGFKQDKSPITNPPNPMLLVNPSSRGLEIEKNNGKAFAVGIEVPPNAVSGIYIFNVNIRQAGQNYVPVQKLYVEVP